MTYKTGRVRRAQAGAMEDLLTPPFATKVAVLVRDDLEPWQRLNVTAFLVSGVTAANPDLVGLALHGPKNGVDRILKGAHLHH